MMNEETSSAGTTTPQRTTEEIREELYRMIDELGTARGLNAKKLQQRFDELWSQLGGERTLH